MTRRPFHRRLLRAARLAVRELRPRASRTAFDGAAMHRLLLDWIAASKSADEEIKHDLRRLRARARELARNNSYVRRFFHLLINNVVGPTGIQLHAQIRAGDLPDKTTNDAIEAAWNEWANGPVTVDGRLTLRQLESLIVKTKACDGEAFVRLWKGFDGNRFALGLQTIDADLVDERFYRAARPGQNEIRMGVEIDDVGRPVGYHVWKKETSSGIELSRERYFVSAEEMIHHYALDRVNQTRGVTMLHSIMIAAHMLDRYEESEAVAARVSAAKMGFFERTAEAGGSDLTIEKAPATIEANPGTFEMLPEGYTVKAFDVDHPAAQFTAFVKQLARKIASGLGIGYNTLTSDAEGVSYSSMRAFSLIERDDWREEQQDLIDGWRRRLYREWLTMSLTSGALRLPSRNPDRYLAVRHRARGWDWIDPEKAAKGSVLAIQHGLGTRTAALAERGEDIEDVFRELKRENELAADLGISIDGALPDDERFTAEEWKAKLDEDAEDAGGGGNGADRDRGSDHDATVPTGIARRRRPRVSSSGS